jgi:hypothetical protein
MHVHMTLKGLNRWHGRALDTLGMAFRGALPGPVHLDMHQPVSGSTTEPIASCLPSWTRIRLGAPWQHVAFLRNATRLLVISSPMEPLRIFRQRFPGSGAPLAHSIECISTRARMTCGAGDRPVIDAILAVIEVSVFLQCLISPVTAWWMMKCLSARLL